MDDKPTQDLATRAFYKRVLDEFAAVHTGQAHLGAQQAEIRAELADMRAEQAAMRAEQAETRGEQAEIRKDLGEMRSQQSASARNLAALEQRLISVEEKLVSLEDKADLRLKESRPIWEAVQEQLTKLNRKFDLTIKDFFELRSEVANHDRIIYELEQKILASSQPINSQPINSCSINCFTVPIGWSPSGHFLVASEKLSGGAYNLFAITNRANLCCIPEGWGA